MYGLMHQALTRWVRTLPNGNELLERIFDECTIEGSVDDFFKAYSDENTMEFLPIVSQVTGYPMHDVMFEAGLHVMETFIENGYETVLKTLGGDFFTMLSNLDSLHDNFQGSFPEMKPPSIRPIRNADDTISVYYYSSRDGIAPFMMGSLKAAAAVLYDLDVDIHHRVHKGKGGAKHDMFHVFLDPILGFPPHEMSLRLGKEMSRLQLSTKLTGKLFPWHFAIDRNLRVTSVGGKLGDRMKKNCVGADMSKVFILLSPIIEEVTFDSLCEVKDKPFLFSTSSKSMLNAEEYAERMEERTLRQIAAHNGDGETDIDGTRRLSENSTFSAFSLASSKKASQGQLDLRLKRLQNQSVIKLHGQFSYLNGKDTLLFVGVPTLQTGVEMRMQGLSLGDLPVHSHGREILYNSMYQAITAKNSNTIQEKLQSLDASMAEVNEKKAQIDGLLHSILPPVVAESLAEGRIPKAESYEKVSVLFSDIAGFTNISSGVPSSEVMTMLHELFMKFDDLALQHGCYKVETIGDAYMVACGCPDRMEDHAQRIAALAIDMVRMATTVTSPLDGEPIRIRVGLHSGPLMAGVVGRARPRYCLFGDTVNVASRMESNGFPGCIQVTYRFLRELSDPTSFVIAPRGHIQIKGKGSMKTFLLLGWQDSDDEPLIPSPEDDAELARALILPAMNPRRFASGISASSSCDTSMQVLSRAEIESVISTRQSPIMS